MPPALVFVSVLMLSLLSINTLDSDAQAIQGTWKAATAEIAGRPMPDEVARSITLIMVNGGYTVTVGENPDRGTYTMDPTAKPKEIDITGTEGPNKGKMLKAIYELDGDTLRICYDLSGEARPTKFKTFDGARDFLITYRREKP